MGVVRRVVRLEAEVHAPPVGRNFFKSTLLGSCVTIASEQQP
jgi:hypothetical protein